MSNWRPSYEANLAHRHASVVSTGALGKPRELRPIHQAHAPNQQPRGLYKSPRQRRQDPSGGTRLPALPDASVRSEQRPHPQSLAEFVANPSGSPSMPASGSAELLALVHDMRGVLEGQQFQIHSLTAEVRALRTLVGHPHPQHAQPAETAWPPARHFGGNPAPGRGAKAGSSQRVTRADPEVAALRAQLQQQQAEAEQLRLRLAHLDQSEGAEGPRRREQQAATAVQATSRGRVVRRELAATHHAATTVQAVSRGRVSRNEVAAVRPAARPAAAQTHASAEWDEEGEEDSIARKLQLGHMLSAGEVEEQRRRVGRKQAAAAEPEPEAPRAAAAEAEASAKVAGAAAAEVNTPEGLERRAEREEVAAWVQEVVAEQLGCGLGGGGEQCEAPEGLERRAEREEVAAWVQEVVAEQLGCRLGGGEEQCKVEGRAGEAGEAGTLGRKEQLEQNVPADEAKELTLTFVELTLPQSPTLTSVEVDEERPAPLPHPNPKPPFMLSTPSHPDRHPALTPALALTFVPSSPFATPPCAGGDCQRVRDSEGRLNM